MTSNQRDELDEIIWKADVDHGVCETKELNGSYDQEWTRCFFFSSRRRHTRSKRTGVQTCALPISGLATGVEGVLQLHHLGAQVGHRQDLVDELLLGIVPGQAEVEGVRPCRDQAEHLFQVDLLLKIGRASCRE